MSHTNITTFDSLPIEDQFFLLASHLPSGRLWSNAFDVDTNLGKLVKALSIEYYRIGVLIEEAARDFDIRQTNQFLLDWEESVGIPQNCFSSNRTLSQRKTAIEGLFSNFAGVQTNADYVRVGALFGYEIDVYAGADTTSLLILSGDSTSTYSLTFPTIKEMKNTVVINLSGVVTETPNFPLEYPIPFYGLGVKFLDCIFRLLSPANVEVYLTTELNNLVT